MQIGWLEVAALPSVVLSCMHSRNSELEPGDWPKKYTALTTTENREVEQLDACHIHVGAYGQLG